MIRSSRSTIIISMLEAYVSRTPPTRIAPSFEIFENPTRSEVQSLLADAGSQQSVRYVACLTTKKVFVFSQHAFHSEIINYLANQKIIPRGIFGGVKVIRGVADFVGGQLVASPERCNFDLIDQYMVAKSKERVAIKIRSVINSYLPWIEKYIKDFSTNSDLAKLV